MPDLAKGLPIIVVVVGSDSRPEENLIRRLLPADHVNDRIQFERVADPGDAVLVQLDWPGAYVYATQSASNPLASRFDITIIPRIVDDAVVTALRMYRVAEDMLREHPRKAIGRDPAEAFLNGYVLAMEPIDRRLDMAEDRGLDYLLFIMQRRLMHLLSTFAYVISDAFYAEGTFFGISGVQWRHGDEYTVNDYESWEVLVEMARAEYGYIIYERPRLNGREHAYAVHRRRDQSLVLLGPKA